MLVLTRKLMEKLFIGDDICVTVVRIETGQIRLGIEAPREVSVVRAELVPERQAAAHQSMSVVQPVSERNGFRRLPCGVRGNGSRRRGQSR